jgi:hypothetical protein
MRPVYELIVTHKSSERNGLRRGEHGTPTGAMFYARHIRAEFSLIGFGSLRANELRFRVRVLAFGQPGEVLISYRPL